MALKLVRAPPLDVLYHAASRLSYHDASQSSASWTWPVKDWLDFQRGASTVPQSVIAVSRLDLISDKTRITSRDVAALDLYTPPVSPASFWHF